MDTGRLEQIRKAHYGFITKEELAEIVSINRLFPLLVRCGGCRFTAPAQDVETLIGYVEAGGDHVRDVSFPAGGENMNLIGNITVDAWGRVFKCQLDLTKYTDGNPAIMVYEGGEPFGKLTINVPEYAHALGPHEFFIKDWSENVPICRACLESDLFVETTRTYRVSSFCTAKVWRLSDKAIANLEET